MATKCNRCGGVTGTNETHSCRAPLKVESTKIDFGRVTISGKYFKFMKFCDGLEESPDVPRHPPDFGVSAALALAKFEGRMFADERLARMFIVAKPGDSTNDYCVVT